LFLNFCGLSDSLRSPLIFFFWGKAGELVCVCRLMSICAQLSTPQSTGAHPHPPEFCQPRFQHIQAVILVPVALRISHKMSSSGSETNFLVCKLFNFLYWW